jgi:hypothetical protein
VTAPLLSSAPYAKLIELLKLRIREEGKSETRNGIAYQVLVRLPQRDPEA